MADLTPAENEALVQVFTDMLRRDVAEAQEAGRISPLTTCLGMLQASLQPLMQVSRPSTVKLLRAYADCMESNLHSPKYNRAMLRFISASNALEEVRKALATSEGSA